MKLNCILIKISFYLLIITFLISYIIMLNNPINYNNQFFSNIFLNVFGGCFVLFLTSIVGYFRERRKNLEKLMQIILNYANKFKEIKYLKEIKYPSFDDYVKMKQPSLKPSVKELLTLENDYYDDLKREFKNLDEIISEYLEISKIDTNDFWNIYEELDFLFGDNKKKTILYDKCFQYVYTIIEDINVLSFHLNLYKKENGNPATIYKIIQDYQDKIFFQDKINKNCELKSEYKEILTNTTPYEIISEEDTNYELFIYNKVVKKLYGQYDWIGQLAYFNKKYKG